MVQVFENTHVFNHDFPTVSFAYLNRYPNPYAKHVKSIDTLDNYVDGNGCLRTTKIIVKTGRLPKFIKPFLGTHLDSWIIEKTIVNPKTNHMLSYTSNVDHRKFVRVEEYLKYSADSAFTTLVRSKVRFSSNLFGFKQKIEDWSRNKFSSNMANSREGLKYVMEKLNERKGVWMRGST